ncbi:MAG: HD domain-containing protein [Candidatus Yanofskybacteria bacterium]|nr:HD domain-containing protein [Candidatus Yanofskybacteria bacterium]
MGNLDKFNPTTPEDLREREKFEALSDEAGKEERNRLHEQALIENTDSFYAIRERIEDPLEKEEIELAIKVCEAVKERGGLALVVGGFARDAALSKFGHNLKPKDIDIEVYGIDQDILKNILDKLGKLEIAGEAFKVFKLNTAKMSTMLDISIPRRDSKTGKGHKGFDVTGDPYMSVKEAARRRDLTINALALDPLTGEILDFYGGIEDIKRKTLRATDKETFAEDSLRVLRAVQFAARFGFSIDEDTKELCRTLDLRELSPERIGGEWLKLLMKAPKPSIGLELALEVGVLDQLHPELKALIGVPQNPKYHPEGDVWTHTKMVIDSAVDIAGEQKLSDEEKKILLLAAVCHDLGKPATTKEEDGKITSYGHEDAGLEPSQKFLEMLFIKKELIERVLRLVECHMFIHNAPDPSDSAIRRLAKRVYPGTIKELANLATADIRGSGRGIMDYDKAEDVLRRAEELSVEKSKPQPLIMGRDLLEIGFKPGTMVGQTLKEILELQLDGEITSTDQAKEYARKKFVEISGNSTNGVEVKERPADNVIIERGKAVNFDELPNNSIALDGYVQGPDSDSERRRYSFDHHDRVSRQITRATCQQILDALLLGFDPSGFDVYINDIDGDTVLSIWLLQHPNKIKDSLIRMLVESIGGIDAHGPAYTALDPRLAEIFFKGVMQPEGYSRKNKEYAKLDLKELLKKCLKNLDDFVSGQFQYESEEDKRSFKIVREGTGWVMAESDDFVFDLLYKASHTRAVAFQQQLDGSYAYTIAKKSDMVSDFPVGPVSKEGTILYELNKIEPGWGGGSSIGGAPRNSDGSRSQLAPEKVFDIIESIVKK